MNRIKLLLASLLPTIAVVILIQTMASTVHAANVGGPISMDTVWTLAESPYVLTEPVTVEAGAILTIEAGVEVRGELATFIDVQGHLEAVGTEGSPILFTSMDDSSGNEWSGIFLTGSAHLNQATVRYTSTAISASGSAGGEVLIENTILEGNNVYPLLIYPDALHRLQMNNVTFQNNAHNRVFIETTGDNDTLAGNVRLTPQPGLEAYEEINSTPSMNLFHNFIVPEGVTLTMEANTTLMMVDDMQLFGHLNLQGTSAEPVTLASSSSVTVHAFYIFVGGTGSTNIVNGVISNGRSINLGIGGDSDKPVIIQDTVLEGTEYPILAEAPALHRLQMTNVTFQNNTYDRVLVEPSVNTVNSLSDDVVLTAQTGLESYEFESSLVVPDGITLTMQPGTTFMMRELVLWVEGHLEAAGTADLPILFTSATDSAPGEWHGILLADGTAHLRHATVRYGGFDVEGYPDSNFNILGVPENGEVLIENSSLSDSAHYPLYTPVDALHQLHLEDVTFTNNITNRVQISTDTWSPEGTLLADVTLASHPGLEGYEIDTVDFPLTVPNGVTLTLRPGVKMMFADPAEHLVVSGTVTATGTAVSSVVLTSAADATPGEWAGVIVNDGSVQLEHTIVRYGINNIRVADTAVGAQLLLQDSQLLDASQTGLSVANGTVTANCTRFSNNAQNGILVASNGASVVTIGGSTISGNGVGLHNQNSAEVDAQGNWWGAANGPGGEGPGNGDVVLGNVLYAPWLTEPGCGDVTYYIFLPYVRQ